VIFVNPTTWQMPSQGDRREERRGGEDASANEGVLESLLSSHPHPDDAAPMGLGQATLTSVQSVFMLCNSAIGAGVLSLPFAFQHAGVFAPLGL
jgi:hypothetical protein